MQKLGYDQRNEGWLYIHLPQSIYLTSPDADRYYFGYSDPRFKYFEEGKLAFREIVTYSFLGFGEFRKTPDGLWSNSKFSVPAPILDMLLESTNDIRDEQIVMWRNLFTRDPELVRQVGSLKQIFPYTRDGMYLYGQNIETEFRKRLLSLQGIVFFHQAADSNLSFEAQLAEHGLPDTKVFKKTILGLVTKDFTYRSSPFNWAALVFQLYGLDNTQNLMRDLPDFFYTSTAHFQIRTEAFAQLIQFLRGVPFQKFRKLVEEDRAVFTQSLFGDKTLENMKWLESNFTLDPKDEEKPYFWAFIDRHKISLPDAIAVISLHRDLKTMLEPIETDIPVLYRDKVLEFRSPRNGLELYGWGKRLHNCLDQKFNAITRRTDRDFIFGIFESDKLVGAVQLSSAFKVRELRAQTNGTFDSEKEKRFNELIRVEIKKLNPAVQMRKALKNQLFDILTASIRQFGLVEGGDMVVLAKANEREMKEKAQVNFDKALKLVTDHVDELRSSHVIDDKQLKTLKLMAPQIVRRTVEQLGTKVPDSLRALLKSSKRQRGRAGIPQAVHSQP